MRSKSLVSLLTLFLVAPAQAEQPAEPQQWLERMSRAIHEQDYRGTFVYRHDGQLQTMQLFHAVRNGQERERLVSLDGPAREVIRDDKTVTCYLPDSQQALVILSGRGHAPWRNLPADIEPLERHYRIELAGVERVAGRPTQKVAMIPRDHLRYGQALWIGRDSGIPLRSALLDRDQRPIEELVFTELALAPMPDASLQPTTAAGNLTWHTSRSPGTEVPEHERQWLPRALPPGFAATGHRRHRLPGVEGSVEHMVYSDGLASVSVFIQSSETAAGEAGLVRMGAVHAYGLEAEGHRITVIGEVPAETVRMVAESIERQD